MGKGVPQANEDMILGERDSAARDPASFNEFLNRARKLGFSAGEIAALRALYTPEKTDARGDAGQQRK